MNIPPSLTALGWTQADWDTIQTAVTQAAQSIRVSTQVYTPQLLPGASTVLDRRVKTTPILSMDEGSAKSFIRITEEFAVTQNQIETNSDTHATQDLAVLVAATGAQVMDGIFFQAQNFKLPQGRGVRVERLPNDGGLFGIAGTGGSTITKKLLPSSGGVIYDGVVEALQALNAKGMATQPKQCALFLESSLFAIAQAALPNTMVTPASSIAPLVAGGFCATSGLKPNTGLLVSLGGDSSDLVIRDDATLNLLQPDRDGYHFEVYESFQYIVKDPRALVQLVFTT